MMTPKSYKILTFGILENFGRRKKANYLGLVCDTKNMKIYPVPVNVEHIEWALNIIGGGYSREAILRNSSLISHLVPAIVVFDPGLEIVEGSIIATSGMEIGFGVRHTSEQINEATSLVDAFIRNGEIPLASNFAIKVIRKWESNT